MHKSLAVLVLGFGFQGFAAQEPQVEKHPFSVHDMVAMERVGEVIPSPNGNWIVFTRKSIDIKANRSTTNLWLVSADGAKTRQLTKTKYASNTSPTWSPDSETIAYVSSEGGSHQIWLVGVNGGKARKLSNFPLDVGNLRWSPDGMHVAFSAEVYIDAKDFEETAKRDKKRSEDPVKAMLFDRLMVRHWDTWKDTKRSHIFVSPISKKGNTWVMSKTPVDLMEGVDADSPTKPFGGTEDFAWSPDGQEIAYTAQLGLDMAWSTDLNIYLVSVNGGATTCISCANKATDRGPIYSPDGKSIAYLAMARPGFESDRVRLKIFERSSQKTKTITERWDRSPSSLTWSSDSNTLYATADESSRQKLFSIDVSAGKIQTLVNENYNGSISVIAGDRLVMSRDSMKGPAEIWTVNNNGTDLKQLTRLNEKLLRQIKVSEPEEFFFEGAKNEKVQGWILKPVDFVQGKKYPVAFIIHGGPQGSLGDHFSYRWNPQAYTGAGYAVIMINFHGSTGFGQDFTDSISGDWGGAPFEDLMKGLDYALANYAWLDAERVGALGASYGGYMINWINGHTDRFKCLVNHDGVFDNIGMYFSTEELWFMEWENGGTPMKNAAPYEKFSPARFADKWKTPTLVIHGGKDFRIADTQGLSTFTALQRQGIPSKLLYFPDENHWVLKPKNTILWHKTVLGWLDEWLKPDLSK